MQLTHILLQEKVSGAILAQIGECSLGLPGSSLYARHSLSDRTPGRYLAGTFDYRMSPDLAKSMGRMAGSSVAPCTLK